MNKCKDTRLRCSVCSNLAVVLRRGKIASLYWAEKAQLWIPKGSKRKRETRCHIKFRLEFPTWKRLTGTQTRWTRRKIGKASNVKFRAKCIFLIKADWLSDVDYRNLSFDHRFIGNFVEISFRFFLCKRVASSRSEKVISRPNRCAAGLVPFFTKKKSGNCRENFVQRRSVHRNWHRAMELQEGRRMDARLVLTGAKNSILRIA